MSIGLMFLHTASYSLAQNGLSPRVWVMKFTILSIPFLCHRYYKHVLIISGLSIAVEKITFKETQHFNALLIWPRRTCSTRTPIPAVMNLQFYCVMLIT